MSVGVPRDGHQAVASSVLWTSPTIRNRLYHCRDHRRAATGPLVDEGAVRDSLAVVSLRRTSSRLAAICLVIVAAVAGLPGSAAAETDLAVEVGYGGIGHGGRSFPLLIEVTTDVLFVGELRISSQDTGLAIARPVEIPGGTTREFTVVWEGSPWGFDTATVQLVSGDEIVASTTVRPVDQRNVDLVGVFPVLADRGIPEKAPLLVDAGEAMLFLGRSCRAGGGLGRVGAPRHRRGYRGRPPRSRRCRTRCAAGLGQPGRPPARRRAGRRGDPRHSCGVAARRHAAAPGRSGRDHGDQRPRRIRRLGRHVRAGADQVALRGRRLQRVHGLLGRRAVELVAGKRRRTQPSEHRLAGGHDRRLHRGRRTRRVARLAGFAPARTRLGPRAPCCRRVRRRHMGVRVESSQQRQSRPRHHRGGGAPRDRGYDVLAAALEQRRWTRLCLVSAGVVDGGQPHRRPAQRAEHRRQRGGDHRLDQAGRRRVRRARGQWCLPGTRRRSPSGGAVGGRRPGCGHCGQQPARGSARGCRIRRSGGHEHRERFPPGRPWSSTFAGRCRPMPFEREPASSSRFGPTRSHRGSPAISAATTTLGRSIWDFGTS